MGGSPVCGTLAVSTVKRAAIAGSEKSRTFPSVSMYSCFWAWASGCLGLGFMAGTNLFVSFSTTTLVLVCAVGYSVTVPFLLNAPFSSPFQKLEKKFLRRRCEEKKCADTLPLLAQVLASLEFVADAADLVHVTLGADLALVDS